MAAAPPQFLSASAALRPKRGMSVIGASVSGSWTKSAIQPPRRRRCPLVLRVLGRLPLKDEAAYTGGRRPRSLRGGKRGTGSLGGARAMDVVVLAVVARRGWVGGVGARVRVAGVGRVAKRGDCVRVGRGDV